MIRCTKNLQKKKEMMNKQTAVEWFVKELFKKIDYIQVDPKLIEQAIAMEKEQIIDAYTECWMMDGGNGNHKLKEANEYFNETYGGDRKPKQDLEKEMFDLEQELDIPSSMRWHNSKPKQETIEEAAGRLYQKGLKDDLSLSFHDGVKFGAKWQAERMYSEEEVLELLHKRMTYTLGDDYKETTTTKWFEQFKNKGGDK